MGKIVIRCTTCKNSKNGLCVLLKDVFACLKRTDNPPEGTRAGYEFEYNKWEPMRKRIEII